jgi:CRP-like cAMP-binding protein
MKVYAPSTDPGSILPILSQISLFGGFSEEQQSRILSLLEGASFETGETIFSRGDEPTHLYIVKSGSVHLDVHEGEAFLQRRMLHVGECFGEASLMSMQRHTASASAAEASEILVLSRRALIELHHADVALFALLMMNTARELARRLRSTNQVLHHYVKDRPEH